jgi:hypothetical protein
MRTQIVTREADVIPPAVVMYREVYQTLIRAVCNPVGYEPRFQHSVAALSGNVVNAVLCKVQIPRQKTYALLGFCCASDDDRSMLVTIAGKQICEGVNRAVAEESNATVCLWTGG